MEQSSPLFTLYWGYSCGVEQRVCVLESLHDLAVIFSRKYDACSVLDNPTVTSACIAHGVPSSSTLFAHDEAYKRNNKLHSG